MKKFCIIALVCLVILVVVLACPVGQNDQFVRIHIRADSDEMDAQNVKYAVKDAVCDYLIPLLAQTENATEVRAMLQKEKANVEKIANEVLRKWGFDYTAKAVLKQEYFPLRTYGNLTLPDGVDWAFILELGEGLGDNWWCVAYPPLCFVNGEGDFGNVTYKSKLLEIIENWYKNR